MEFYQQKMLMNEHYVFYVKLLIFVIIYPMKKHQNILICHHNQLIDEDAEKLLDRLKNTRIPAVLKISKYIQI